MKRPFDIAASFFGLILLSPLLVVAAILIKVTSRGPVIFRQERIGRNFRPFTIYKFRTMVMGAHEMGPGVAASNDPRITSFGRILRKTKIDELPQLYNVLRGDMSLVGPRPELPQYVKLFRTEYAEVLVVRPGITDPASIAYRDEAHLHSTPDPEDQYLHVILPEKLRLAREYVHKSSFLYDIQLILTTLGSLAYPGKSLDRALNSLAPHRYPIAAVVQSALIVLANYLAFLIRFEGRIPDAELHLLLTTAPILLALRLAFFYPFRLYRGLWRYVSIRDIQSIAASVTLSSAAWWTLSRFIPRFSTYPPSVLILDWLFCLMLLGGVRLLRRTHRGHGHEVSSRRSVLIVGSGDSTERILRGLMTTGQREYRVVGLIDDESDHKGALIHNVRVMGTIRDLESVIRREDPDEILFAMPATKVDERKEVFRQCKKLDKPVKVIPDLRDMMAGRDVGSLVPEIEPEDLLFREPVRSNIGALMGFYRSKRILITGAGGSIGSEISRQAAACRPDLLVLFEKHEASLYMVDKELRGLHPDLNIETVIGDITDEERVREVLKRSAPQVVFHAAAYKHVPMMEINPAEAVKTNVFGTKLVSELAGEFQADAFVLISTDKAVEPMGVMGRSKRMAELMLQGLHGSSRTRYVTVRFGNVLESSGSVIPLFREQIERGGPITVTHPEITRLFMTIPEAVQLILQAGSMGMGGEIFVLDMGKPIRILDLAKALIRRYGLHPGKDIEIVFTGLRPGERLFEKLVNDHERVWKTPDPKILRAVSEGSRCKEREEFLEHLAAIESAAGGEGTSRIFACARQLLPRTEGGAASKPSDSSNEA